MKNFIIRSLGLLFLAFCLVILGRDIIIQGAAAGVVRASTGLALNIGAFHSSLLKSTIQIKELKLFNPPGYSDKIMFHLPEVFVAFDPASLASGKPHLKEVRLHVAVLEVERNKDGKLNLSELKPTGSKKTVVGNKTAHPLGVHIDVLKLQIDKVIYKDYSSAIPMVREFNLNINKTYTNINDVRALAPIIVGDVLRNSALSSLIHFDVGDLLQNFQSSGVSIADLGLNQISGLTNSGLGQTAQSVVTSVTDQIGSLFGGSSGKK